MTATAERLPKGRHGLSREEVVGAQRARMLQAMSEAVAERGYVATPVAEVLRRAGVSRETFYEQFSNKEECFLAAYEFSVQAVLGGLGDVPASAGEGDPLAALEAGLERYLAALAAEPAIARTFLVEVYAAGEQALARRAATQDLFVGAIAARIGARTGEQRFACAAAVAAIIGIVTQRACAGRLAEVRELHEPLARNLRATLAAAGLPRPHPTTDT